MKLKSACAVVFGICFAFMLCAPKPAFAADSNGNPVMVSLGDSYSSGEGNDPYYGQNSEDKYSKDDWVAHRSTLSWPGRLYVGDTSMSSVKDSNWFFYAVSGAETKHIYYTHQTKRVQKSILDALSLSSSATNYSFDTQLGLVKQNVDTETVDYVTITIGGNDMGFSDIISEVALNANVINRDYLYDAIGSAWDDYFDSVESSLIELYKELQTSFTEDTKILVGGYPTLLNETGLNWQRVLAAGKMTIASKGLLVDYASVSDVGAHVMFDSYEAAYINTNVRRFNNLLEGLVKAANLEAEVDDSLSSIYFVSVEELFEGHEVWTSDPYLYGVSVRKSQDINYEPVSASSVHPNSSSSDKDGGKVDDISKVNSGISAYAYAFQQKIDALESGDLSEDDNASSQAVIERDIVLTLDVSGSMVGDKIEAVKESVVKFGETVFEADAHVGVVSFADLSTCLAKSSASLVELSGIAQGLSAGGGTNIEDGLVEAYSLLCGSNAEKQIIVLMSDGEPTLGKQADELIALADKIKQRGVLIYTLGFFSYSGVSQPQQLLESIASPGCHFEVSDASDLVFFFGDIADQLNGVKYNYIRIACPVDVEVSYEGETLSSVDNTKATRTAFGTLTFEDAQNDEDGSSVVEEAGIKILRLKEGPSYELTISGTGEGTMNYTIGFIDDAGEYSDMRYFEDIAITPTTQISTVAEAADTTRLSVDDDGDGVVDVTYAAGANEVASAIDNSWVGYLVTACFACVCALAIVLWIFIARRRRNRRRAAA